MKEKITQIDMQKGTSLLKMAADKGNTDSMFVYANYMFKGGKGLKQDFMEASKYMKMAADKGTC